MRTRLRLKWLGVAVAGILVIAATAMAQTITPPSIAIGSTSPVCSGGTQEVPISITLPPDTVLDSVDVFMLFDDTGSFASFVPGIAALFPAVVSDLETALPGVSFGFGVGRLEDYGGDGSGFSGETAQGRPFTLNQPIVTAATAGGSAARDALITTALNNTAPGFGGDTPETDIEALYQVATGAGFDGNGNGNTTDSGAAGAAATQTAPGTSGDVPAFGTNVLPASGTLGGAGFRSGALHLVLLATDTSSVSPFPAGSAIPATITGTGGSEPSSAFATSSTTPGFSRFGFVSDSKTSAANTVAGAVAPSGSAAVQATIDALNGLGISVIGLGPGAAPTTSAGPSSDESVLLSALARLTGALDTGGNPLVFSTSVPAADLAAAIADVIETSATAPVDITLANTALPAGLTFGFSPSVVNDVSPGGTANFTVMLTGDGSAISGGFDIQFKDATSGAVLGTLPVTISCEGEPPADLVVTGHGRFNTGGKGQVQFTVSNDAVWLDRNSGKKFTFSGDVDSVTGGGNTATLTGTGTWNGVSGHTFEITVVDVEPFGRLKDTIAVVIRGPGGEIVFENPATVLKPGDISVTERTES
jgi:hypothetical protein